MSAHRVSRDLRAGRKSKRLKLSGARAVQWNQLLWLQEYMPTHTVTEWHRERFAFLCDLFGVDPFAYGKTAQATGATPTHWDV